MKVLHTFKKQIVISLNEREIDQAFQALNMHYLGVDNCNIRNSEGRLVARFPEKETDQFKQSHYNCRRGKTVTICINLMEDGSLQLQKNEN